MLELPSIIKKSLEKRGLKELRPPQELSLKKGLLQGKSLVISSPTSSGKTLVAEIAMIKHYENKGKTLYIVPLKSLASEKYQSFKERYEESGVRVAMSIGDFDKQDPYLNNYDVIITTSEKADSLIRHNASFLRGVTCVVIDEVHLLDDAGRGPTLEVLITILKQMLPSAQLIALSATISNDKELSEWLNADLVKSDYRPVELHEGVFFNDEFHFLNHSYKTKPYKGNEETIMKDTLEKKKQIIFFLNSRRNAQALPKRLLKLVDSYLTEDEKSKLSITADEILYALEQPTDQCRLLSDFVRHGCAFHHAGLVQKQKNIIENAFREKLIKVVCATPTLAAGVNLPAFRVVVRDLSRFSQSQGTYFLPVLEVKQMFGRAGRPGFEDYGEALAIAKSENEKDTLFEEYINGVVENIYSKLGVEPALRTHVLSLISNRFCNDYESLKSFFKKTFFAKQYSKLSSLNLLIENIITMLVHYGFVEEKEKKLSVTNLGRRVCELYLDPLVADNIIQAINTSKRIKPEHFNVFQALCYSGEVRLLSVKNLEVTKIISLGEEKNLLIDAPNPFSYEYDSYIRSIKTSLLFESWINEESEQSIIDNYKIYPGDLRNYIYTIDWLLYSTSELANILGVKNIIGVSKRLRTRVAYGIRDELFSLVSIKGIGRVRARKLYNNGVLSYEDVMNTPTSKLASIIGPGIAKKIKEY